MAADPDRPLFVLAETGEVLSISQFERRANQFARCLRQSGISRSDNVALCLENGMAILECAGGSERAGVYYTPINTHLGTEEIAFIVNDAGAKVFVTSQARFPIASSLPAQCPHVTKWLVVGEEQPPDPWHSYATLSELDDSPIADQQVGMPLFYSSGTTGRPKGVIKPLPDFTPDEVDISPFFEALGFRENMTYLSTAPLYHSAPLGVLGGAVRLGAINVIMEHFDPASFLSFIKRYDITHTQAVPTMFSRLLKLPEPVRAFADVSTLEVLLHGAAPCPVQVKADMISWFGPVLTEYYAASEGIGFTVCDSDEWLLHRGSVGRAVLESEVFILDDEHHQVPIGTDGVVWFGGPGARSFSYLNDAQKTDECQIETELGLLSTTWDVGHLDGEGYLYLTDRRANMIISGGVNIYPQEAENLLITHCKVADAAVFGIPNEEFGEEVKAVVQPADGVEPSAELAAELIQFCRDGLAHFKCPKSVDFENPLPRLPTGKLYKRLLRDRYWTGRSTSIV